MSLILFTPQIKVSLKCMENSLRGKTFVVIQENVYSLEKFHGSMLVYSHCWWTRPYRAALIHLKTICSWVNNPADCKSFLLERFTLYGMWFKCDEQSHSPPGVLQLPWCAIAFHWNMLYYNNFLFECISLYYNSTSVLQWH